MKKEYKIKDKVWIHLGERNLVEGRVVEIIDLEHLNEGYNRDNELYIIEIPTHIEPVYEVRNFAMISSDAKGPSNAFKVLDPFKVNRFTKKVGMVVPVDLNEPTPEQIHAAMERAERAKNQPFNTSPRPAGKRPAKKRTFTKRKKPDVTNS